MSTIVSPSMLSADFLNLGRDIDMINNSEADWLHIDIMDGMFVPNISYGMSILSQVNSKIEKPLDVHLMIEQPDRYLEDFKKAGAAWLTVHYEACTHLHRTIQQIKKLGMKAGVALNPHTPVALLEEIMPDLDLVLIMSVNPGFGGQSFIEGAIEKVKKTKALIRATGSRALVEVDGGVNFETGKRLIEAGADALVAGSFVFNAENPTERIKGLKAL